jgi:S-DNA-T family DNA segregation ATPase FtsK/SpoIIIE
MALKVKSVYIDSIPEKGKIAIQVPNSNPSIVRSRSILESKEFQQCNFELPLALGKTADGNVYIEDLAKMPHLLIAGSSGSGKSVGMNQIIASLLFKKHPREMKFVFIDPKKVELSHYSMLSKHYIATLP